MRLPARFSMLRLENPAKSLRSTKRSMFSLKFSSFRDSRIELSASVGNVSKKLLFKLSRATLFLPKTPGSSDFNAFLLRSSSSRNFWSCEMDHIYKIYLNLNICICQYKCKTNANELRNNRKNKQVPEKSPSKETLYCCRRELFLIF